MLLLFGHRIHWTQKWSNRFHGKFNGYLNSFIAPKINFPVWLKTSIFKMIYKRKSPANQRPLKFKLRPLDRTPRSLWLCNYVRSSRLLMHMHGLCFLHKLGPGFNRYVPNSLISHLIGSYPISMSKPGITKSSRFSRSRERSQFLAVWSRIWLTAVKHA